MGLIKKLFGGADEAAKPDLATPSQLERGPDSRLDSAPPSRPAELEGKVGTRRELLRVLTRDTQRYAGMPDGWIECQVLLELGREGQTLMHLRLVLREWNESLLRYHLAFQRKLLADLERFEPDFRDWLLSVTWQYLVDDAAPCMELPDPITWGSPESIPLRDRMPTGDSQLPADSVEQDLAALYAVRDANMAAPSAAPGAGRRVAPPADPQPDRYHRKV